MLTIGAVFGHCCLFVLALGQTNLPQPSTPRSFSAENLKGGHARQSMRMLGESAAKILLNITYAERIAVPKGSAIQIDVTDPSGQQRTNQSTRTKTEGPPYQVEMKLPRSENDQGWQVEVILQSASGHRFAKKKIVTADEQKQKSGIDFMLELQ